MHNIFDHYNQLQQDKVEYSSMIIQEFQVFVNNYRIGPYSFDGLICHFSCTIKMIIQHLSNS